MKDLHKCDICGKYESPYNPVCEECEMVAFVKRKMINRQNNELLEGDYDEGNYVTS